MKRFQSLWMPGLAALLALVPAPRMIAASDPALTGSFLAVRETVNISGMAGATLSADVIYPRDGASNVDPAAKPCPVIVLGHGFSQSKSQHTNQGLHLASRGYIVLIPNFAGGSDHSRNADDLSKCLDWIVARNADPSSRYFQAVRVARMGATGHSAGGLSALVAASRDPRIRAVAPMDPVDNASLGVTALASVNIPVAITYSEPSSCNANGSAAVLLQAVPAAKRGIKIVGANHTDPQDPAGFLSIITCGAANTTRQMLYRRYVTGWFEYYLKGDQSYAPFVFDLPGGQTADDISANRITYQRTPPASAIAEWRLTNFGDEAGDDGIAGLLADPDSDGRLNIEEYGTGTDPGVPSANFAPFLSLVGVGGDSFGAITFTRATMATDVSITVEVSPDLLIWTEGSRYAATGSTPNTAVTTEVLHTGSGLETITVRANKSTVEQRNFLRLKIGMISAPANLPLPQIAAGSRKRVAPARSR